MSHTSTDATITSQPEIVLAALDHAGDGASACDQALPRLSTFAAMQGLWRPTLGSSDKGFMVIVPQQPGQESSICGIAIDPSKAPSGVLYSHTLPAGSYAESLVHGDWDSIQHAAESLIGPGVAHLGRITTGPWQCLFRTNPRSTDAKEWESIIRVAIAPQP
jgi:DNA gyrase inhibitor GyrI